MAIEPYSGILNEHEGAKKEGEPTGEDYNPTEEERRAIKLAHKIFLKNKKAREATDSKWLDYYKMFRGKQWKNKRPSYRHSEVINFVFRTIQSLVPIQTDFRPQPEFLPEEPSDLEFAEILNQVARADWDKNAWSETLLDILYDGNITGTGISSSEYDQEADFGRGLIQYESIDPLYVYPDPEARDFNKRCECVVIAEPREVSKVKRQYKKVAKYIKPDVADILKGEKKHLHDLRVRSAFDDTMRDGSDTPMEDSFKDMVLVLKVYIRPEYFDDDPTASYQNEVEAKDEQGNPIVDPETGMVRKEYETRARWPNGRKIVIAGGVLCEDDHNPYEDGDLPFERFVNYLDPRMFWGIGEVEQIEGPQKIFNKVFSFALDVLTLMGNPIWLNPTNSGVDDDMLTTQPGLIVPHNPEGAPTRVDGAQLQPHVMQIAQQIEQWINDTAGANDITQGNKPAGVTAASAIDMLQEASHTRIRQKSRNLDRYLQAFARHYLSRALQYYSAPRIIRLTGNENATNYFRMQVETLPDGRKVATVQPYTDAGLLDPAAVRQYEIRGKFDARVNTGSALPFAKAEKEQRLLNFLDRGLIDAEEVLKQSEYPNYEAVLNRMAQKAQQEAMAQMQAGAAPPAKVAA